MKLLALDIATVTGWAAGEPCGSPVHGVIDLKEHSSLGGRAYMLMQQVGHLIIKHHPDKVIFEQPLHTMGAKGGNAKTLRLLQGLPTVVEVVCHLNEIPIYEVATSTWRKHFLGHGGLPGKEAKAYAMQLCRERGWMVHDDNEAEACGIWDWACAKVDRKHGVKAGMFA